jgi:polyhydroxyalkanoate synthase
VRERGDSAWLGQPGTGDGVFQRYRDLDRWLLASIADITGGLAPATLSAAAVDWWIHLLASPAKRLDLLHEAAGTWVRLAHWGCTAGTGTACPFEPLPQDKRFDAPEWQAWPFAAYAQAFLGLQHIWQRATNGVPGVRPHHEAMVSFGARQWLDMVAPSNSILTNPVVLKRTLIEGGANLMRGALHAGDDALREALDQPPAGASAFKVGKNIAVTPGKVILRNRLAEVIQYEPTTPRTHREPVLLVPAWIMKYYILDLSPHNSMVKALVDRGFTVFMVSWKNPVAEDRDTSLDDYFHFGVEAALDAIARVLPGAPVHALGYCLGGTLLAMAAAALSRSRPQALKSLTLLAAQTDFTDPGELSLFIDDGQVELLDAVMWRRGFLDARRMKGTFAQLRSRDLIWSYRVMNYLMGVRQPVSDLMAWNSDGTRLPYKMHSQYLHTLFLDNALAHGQARLAGQAINLADIRVPIFNVGAVQDHVAPWRSVFKLHGLTDAEQTFVLTAGGHNVGIVNPPDQTPTSHRLRRWRAGDRILTPDEWLECTETTDGSWWTAWFQWLARHSSGMRKPPRIGGPGRSQRHLAAAPGQYVLER